MGARRRTNLLYRFGLEKSPDRSVPDSHTPVVSGTLTSAHMSSPVKWSISVPAGALTGVVYCLHGWGEDHRFAFDHIYVPDFAAAERREACDCRRRRRFGLVLASTRERRRSTHDVAR